MKCLNESYFPFWKEIVSSMLVHNCNPLHYPTYMRWLIPVAGKISWCTVSEFSVISWSQKSLTLLRVNLKCWLSSGKKKNLFNGHILWHVLFNLTKYLYACLCFCFSVILLSLIFHIALVHCSICFPHPSASLLHLLSISDLLESCLGRVQSLDYFLHLNKIIL